MVDADEAEARVQAAVEKTEAHRRAQVSAQAAELQARREAERTRHEKEQARHEAERARRRVEQRQREAQELLASTRKPQPVVDEIANEEAARAAWAGVRRVNGGFAAEEPVQVESRPRFELDEREEKRSAKEAARLIAALEKKEARERKALAKAAAKRRLAGTYRS